MGLFDLFKKKPAPGPQAAAAPITVAAAAAGQVLPMSQVPDPIFNQGALGRCCGIEPCEGRVYAPVAGKVTQVADTLHALGFETPDGVQVLVHIGVETVDMKGDGFATLVKVGDTVACGQPVLTMDLAKIKAAGHPATVIVVIVNSDDFAALDLTGAATVAPGDTLLTLHR